MAGLFHRLREMYRKDGGAFPDPLLNLTWDYVNPVDPNPEDIAKEMNGRALVDLKDDSGKTIVKAGRQLDGFAQLRDDGSTMCGCWIFSGCFTENGNQMARRDATDPREAGHRAELGVGVAGEPAHPLQSRQRRSVAASRGIRPSR